MRKIYPSIVAAALTITFLLLGTYSISNSTGAPAGRTGSPGDNGLTCVNGCHTGGPAASGQVVSINTSSIPAGGYVPGAVYDISVNLSPGASGTLARVGFQATAEFSNGSKAGSMMSINNTTQAVGVGSRYITHTSNGTTGGASKTWNFRWTAPTTGGNVTFYATALDANNNGNNSGDVVVQATPVNVQEDVTVGLNEDAYAFTVYPNPASDKLVVSANDGLKSVVLLDMRGQIVEKKNFEGQDVEFDLSALPAGSYLVSCAWENGIYTHKQVVKQ
jgi:hypothetical protein